MVLGNNRTFLRQRAARRTSRLPSSCNETETPLHHILIFSSTCPSPVPGPFLSPPLPRLSHWQYSWCWSRPSPSRLQCGRWPRGHPVCLQFPIQSPLLEYFLLRSRSAQNCVKDYIGAHDRKELDQQSIYANQLPRGRRLTVQSRDQCGCGVVHRGQQAIVEGHLRRLRKRRLQLLVGPSDVVIHRAKARVRGGFCEQLWEAHNSDSFESTIADNRNPREASRDIGTPVRCCLTLVKIGVTTPPGSNFETAMPNGRTSNRNPSLRARTANFVLL